MKFFVKSLSLVVVSFVSFSSFSQENSTTGDAELAQELTNPLASLITIPIQINFDDNIGSLDEGKKTYMNVQPVIPFEIGDNWNVITRTIIPFVSQKNVIPGTGSQSGLGDINLSLFFSPKKPTQKGIIWGVGPVFLLPTATDDLLGTKKWSAGPGLVALTNNGPWTLGILANQIWSFAGKDDRDDINNTFVQPFVAYTWPNAWTISVQSEATYNWETDAAAVPINFSLAKLVRFGRLPVSLQAGVGNWLKSPETGADGWRFRLQANIVLLK